MKDKIEELSSNEVSLFGQRFHACVGVTYVGLGVILSAGFRRWFPGGTDWLPLIGFVMLFGGAAWWLLLWRRQRKDSLKVRRHVFPPTADSLPDFGRTPEAAEYLASALERLLQLPLSTAADVEAWKIECCSVRIALQREFPTFEPFHELWHFFSDADIRARDIGYRDRQHRLISAYVHSLRQTQAA